MFHQSDLKLKEKLSNKFEEKKKIINQDIFIRDIFVYPSLSEQSYCESQDHDNQYSQYPLRSRLLDHIRVLANITNAYHQKYFCNKNEDGTYKIKDECLNKITRISLNEFSLYTAIPISISGFSSLMNAIYAIAKDKQPNVHLLLSSAAVMTEDEKILNMSLYVQCGREPKIETFCKGRPSNIDITYEDTSNFTQQLMHSGKPNISGYISSEKGVTVSNNTVFSVKTEGGAEYIQAVDVCLDHQYEHSKILMEKLVNADITTNTNPIPNQVDHLLTSNTINIHETSKVSEFVIHVDPWKDIAHPMRDDVVTVSNLGHFKKKKYSKMAIKKDENDKKGFLVENPSFGSSYTVIATEERKLGNFPIDLKKIIDNKNIQIKKHAIEPEESELKQANKKRKL